MLLTLGAALTRAQQHAGDEIEIKLPETPGSEMTVLRIRGPSNMDSLTIILTPENCYLLRRNGAHHDTSSPTPQPTYIQRTVVLAPGSREIYLREHMLHMLSALLRDSGSDLNVNIGSVAIIRTY